MYAEREDGVKTQGEDSHVPTTEGGLDRPSARDPQEDPPLRTLDLRLSASRTGRSAFLRRAPSQRSFWQHPGKHRVIS